ncbi:hypothetical protein J4558_01085 [Leptolyngbya sp. 15MV]|nr:hypothetical protein J4558_01085 [Leptolyngbya sp. 15MV]
MRRSLVLTDESARHPFRASLPPHVRADVAPVAPRGQWLPDRDDLRRFFTTYCASLVVVTVLIA